MSSLTSLESIYGTLTADITAKTAKLERVGNRQQRGGTGDDDHDDDDDDDDEDGDRVFAALLTDIEKLRDEAEDVLEQIELDIRGLDAGSAERDRRLNQWQSHRVELRRLVAQVERTKKGIREKRDRRSLLGAAEEGLLAGDGGGGDAHNEKLLDNTETVERSGRKLNVGYRLLAETENIGTAVLEDLSEQRETIRNARAKLRDTQGDLQASSRVLTKMLFRIVQNRIVLFLVAFVIVAVIVGGIIYSLSPAAAVESKTQLP